MRDETLKCAVPTSCIGLMYPLACYIVNALYLVILRGLEGGTSATDKTQSGYEGAIIKRTTPLLLTCSITSHHSESDSAQMETTMSQSCYCL